MAKFAGAVGYPLRVSRKGKVFPTCEPRKGHCGSSERRDKGVHLNNARLVTKSWCPENTSAETRETPDETKKHKEVEKWQVLLLNG
ncbi:MAG: hypothetical protein ABID54_01125 [Pseudomonadota bacterium]